MASASSAFAMFPGKRQTAVDRLRAGTLLPFAVEGEPFEIDPSPTARLPRSGSQPIVLAAYRLQDLPDFRGALQSWFGMVRSGGYLVVIVPHAHLFNRQLALPAQWHQPQRRLYTPRSLLEEVEEALEPNSYRVRHLGDDDHGYDYAAPAEHPPVGASDVVLAIEKIVPPSWTLEPVHDARDIRGTEPDYGFEPLRTRIEAVVPRSGRRILVLKLDHFGDFLLGMSALERARSVFSGSEITLVVGSWNADMARQMGVADRVLAFDAFPRNSSEEEVNVAGKAAMFQALVTDEFDLAIDLRTDTDTRFLLRTVRATLKAGVGTRAQFPFLDIFLPLDFNRNRPETAREDDFDHHAFASQHHVRRHAHRLVSVADQVERHCAVIWGPYRPLRPGRYVFEPHLELAPDAQGMLKLDIGLDAHTVAEMLVPSPDPVRLPFTVEAPDALFEFRVWAVENERSIDFSFYGGRLIRQGAASVLHQSEYPSLLIELVAMRLHRTGVLGEITGVA